MNWSPVRDDNFYPSNCKEQLALLGVTALNEQVKGTPSQENLSLIAESRFSTAKPSLTEPRALPI